MAYKTSQGTRAREGEAQSPLHRPEPRLHSCESPASQVPRAGAPPAVPSALLSPGGTRRLVVGAGDCGLDCQIEGQGDRDRRACAIMEQTNTGALGREGGCRPDALTDPVALPVPACAVVVGWPHLKRPPFWPYTSDLRGGYGSQPLRIAQPVLHWACCTGRAALGVLHWVCCSCFRSQCIHLARKGTFIAVTSMQPLCLACTLLYHSVHHSTYAAMHQPLPCGGAPLPGRIIMRILRSTILLDHLEPVCVCKSLDCGT